MDQGTSTLIMIVVLFLVMYFMMIRPENKRKKEAQQMRESLKKGDKITTIGGIIGTIVHVGPDTLVIETSDDRVRMEITKWAISTTGVQASIEPDKKKKKGKKEEAVEEALPEEPVNEIPASEDENN